MEVALREITKVYRAGQPQSPAVDNVSLTIPSGEFFFLLGPSGCGKTTLLRIIAGLCEPTAGRILFGQRDVTRTPAENRNTAMVFQSYALWPHMSVLQNVEFGPKMRHVAREERRRIAAEQLVRVEMAAYAGRRPNQLSGGQQQRVALARALAARADLLLLDEPLSNLDARLRLAMRGHLRRLVKSSGTTAIYVTHDQTEAMSMADRVAVMNDGKIVQVGTGEELYAHPATMFVADFLGEANFISGRLIDAGPPARIRTPLGVVLAAGPAAGPAGPAGRQAELKVGTEVSCCVRPERITIRPGRDIGPTPGRTNLPATVESSVYLGQMRQYLCRMNSPAAGNEDDAAGGPAGGERDGARDDTTGGRPLWKVSALADGPGAIAAGEQVTLQIDADGLAVLEKT